MGQTSATQRTHIERMPVRFNRRIVERSRSSELASDDLAADGLRELFFELHNSRILIRRGMLLDVVLDFLLQLLRALGALDEHDAGLDDLPAHLVRRSGHAALEHIRQLHDDVFDLERPDAVAGGLDDVVRAANVPVEAVLIAPREVAGVVESVVPDGLGALLVLIIAEEQPAEVLSSRGMDDDLARVAVGSRGAVLIDKVDAVAGDEIGRASCRERV